MIFSLYTQYGALNSKPVFAAFEKSLRRAGHQVTHNNPNSDVAVIWSVLWHGRMAHNKQVWTRYTQSRRPVVVLEVGGIQRGTTWKVGLNGVNRDAYFSPGGHDNARAKKLGLKLKEWKHNQNGAIIIASQHHQSQQWHNQPPIEDWVKQTVEKIRTYTDRRIIVRPHPRCPLTKSIGTFDSVSIQNPNKIRGSYDDFDFDYASSWAVVNWSSNPAVQAVRGGIPVFTGPSSLAWPVSNPTLDTIENPLKPDRTQWLNDLAHTEYTIDEIAKGLPLAYLTEKLS